MNPAPNIRSIRARAKKICEAAGVQYSRHYPTRIRGYHKWTDGVTIEETCRSNGRAVIYAHAESLLTDTDAIRARAIAALRAAGWTVDDDGLIRDVPTPQSGPEPTGSHGPR